jgi:hypothetical protein
MNLNRTCQYQANAITRINEFRCYILSIETNIYNQIFER